MPTTYYPSKQLNYHEIMAMNTCIYIVFLKTTASGPGGEINLNAGYDYRRLVEKVITGVYECNSFCKCHNTCLNRVAQRPLQSRLQVNWSNRFEVLLVLTYSFFFLKDVSD